MWPKLVTVLAIAMGVGVGAGAPADPAAARSASVRIVSAPSAVVQGGKATVAASVAPPSARCLASVRPFSGGTRRTLGSRRPQRGRATWSWIVSADATPGRWRLSVSCGRAGSASRLFTVERRTTPARVEVVRSGFTQSAASDEFRGLTYGLVLVNRSPDEAALDVRLLINLVDTANRVIQTDSYSIDYISTGGTFNFGQSEFDVRATVARLEVSVALGSSKVETRPSLAPENVRIEEDFRGNAEIVGEVRNTTAQPLSGSARISAVAFDSRGNVAGGGSTYPDAAVPPGFRVGFELDLRPLIPSQIASVAVSVEADFVD